MENGLTSVIVCIYDNTIAIFRDSFISRDLGRSDQQVAEKHFVLLFIGLRKRSYVFFWNYKNVYRRLW